MEFMEQEIIKIVKESLNIFVTNLDNINGNLFHISEKILEPQSLTFPLFCTKQILDYVKQDYKNNIDKKIHEIELDNIDLISCENSDSDNKKYNELIIKLKEKLSIRYSLTIKTIDRLTYLFNRVRDYYEINNEFTFYEYNLDDIKILIEKKYDDQIGSFYLLSKLN